MAHPPLPPHDLAARVLLDNAAQAQAAVRRERRGLWGLVENWLERRDWHRRLARREQQAQRCREHHHDMAGWRIVTQGRRIFPAGKVGPQTLPVRVVDIYRGHCRHCGHPQTLTLDA